MSDLGNFDDILRKLAEPMAQGGRVLSSQDAGDLREQLLTAIERTILPRTLSIENHVGEKIHVEVARRRILRVVAAMPEKMVTIDGLIGAKLSPDDRNLAAALSDLLERIVSRATSLTLNSSALSRTLEAGEIGIVAQQVAPPAEKTASDAAPADLPELSKVETFAIKIKSETAAWIVLQNGEVIKRHGTAEAVNDLKAYAQAELDRLENQHRAHYPDARDIGLAVRAQISEGSECVIHGWSGDTSILAIGPAKATPSFLALWMDD